MSEQVIWIGEKQLELEPAKPEYDPDIVRQAQMTEFEELKTRRLGDMSLELILRSFGEEKVEPTGKAYLDEPYKFYSDVWQKMQKQPKLPESQEADRCFRNLRHKIILDLGNGEDPTNFQHLLSAYNPAGYIGVDVINRLNPDRNPKKEDYGDIMYYDTDKDDVLEGALIRGDLLRVTSRLPPNSVSVAIHGLDNIIVHMETPYGQRLLEEVLRILDPRGIVFGLTVEQGILVELSKRPEMKVLEPTIPEKGIYLLSKA